MEITATFEGGPMDGKVQRIQDCLEYRFSECRGIPDSTVVMQTGEGPPLKGYMFHIYKKSLLDFRAFWYSGSVYG